LIALIGSSHWDVTATGAFPARGAVSVGEVMLEGPAGSTLNTASHLLARRPLLITQRPHALDPRHAELLAGVDLVAADVDVLSSAMIVFDAEGERSIFLVRRHTPWPAAPPLLTQADVVDWHWTAPADRLAEYAPLLRGRVVTPIRSVEALLAHGVRPWAVIDSLSDAAMPDPGWLADAGCAWCIMTLGAGGGRYWVEGAWFSYPAVETEVVDTIGCGDAFRAGILAAIDDGLDLEEAVLLAAEWGARAARAAGANRFMAARK
jgi:sugar/nucleoside kinase (ribokinase family)